MHANSTFDEMRAREIKVERAPSTTYVGRISGSAGTNGRPTDRPTDAFATHFSTFPGIGVSGRGRAGSGGEQSRASAFLHKLNFVPRSLSLPSSSLQQGRGCSRIFTPQ